MFKNFSFVRVSFTSFVIAVFSALAFLIGIEIYGAYLLSQNGKATPQPSSTTRPKGFTLIETMVVIIIIGILASILLPALSGARNSAKRAAIQMEMRGFKTAFTRLTLEHASPTSRLVASETGNYSPAFFTTNSISNKDRLRSIQEIRRIWPRVALSTTGPAAPIPGIGFYDFNGNGKLDATPYILSGDECFAFLLGGICVKDGGKFIPVGFAKDPRNPFQPDVYVNSLGRDVIVPHSTPYAPLDSSRLYDLDNDGIPAYDDGYGGEFDRSPYAFFAPVGGGGSYDPSDMDVSGEATQAFFNGTYSLSAGPNPYSEGPVIPVSGDYSTGDLNPAPSNFLLRWKESNSFQIITAGADRKFGTGGWWNSKVDNGKFPSPNVANGQVPGGSTLPDNTRNVETDNITNFSGDTLDSK